MKAAVVRRYGAPDAVTLEDIPTPQPRANDVLLRVEATAVTAADARIRGANFPRGFGFAGRLAFGLRAPRHPVLGSCVAGTVLAVGERVRGMIPGQRVAAMTGARMGAHAEMVAFPAAKAVPVPDGVGSPHAVSALFGGSTAWHFLHARADLRPDESVVVLGAAGSVGSAMVQLAAVHGANVTAVTSPGNEESLLALGAERVLFRTPEDPLGGAPRAHVVIDTHGVLGLQDLSRVTLEGGRLLLLAADLSQTLRARGRVLAGPASEDPAVLAKLLALVDAGDFTPLTTVHEGLGAIQACHALIDAGAKVGNLVVVP